MDEPIYTCATRDPGAPPSSFGEFLPVYVSALNDSMPNSTYTLSKCFETVDFAFESLDDSTFNIHVTTGKKTGLSCKEAFLFANTEIFHIEVFAFSGKHTLQFKTPTAAALADLNFGGIKVFEFCDGAVGTIESVWNSMKAFIGGLTDKPNLPYVGSHVPPYMEKANVEFLDVAMGYHLEPRVIRHVEIDPDLI